MQSVRDWLQQPVILSEVLPYGVLALLLAAALAGLARSTRRAARTRPSSGATRPEGFLARWFRTMRLGPGEDLLIRATFAAFALLFVMALGAAFVLVAQVFLGVFAPDNGQTPTASLGLGALLVALLGAPFLIWRTLVAQRTLEATHRQTDLQDEALFNDKINAAATDLAARRQVTRVGKDEDGKEVVLTEWQDDLVTRAAAIDRLEGLTKEAIGSSNSTATQRIARMLSIYVQESRLDHFAEISPDDSNEEEFDEWIFSRKGKIRTDIQRAVKSLGRLQKYTGGLPERVRYVSVYLGNCNLQGFDLRDLSFDEADFVRADMEGCNLVRSSLRNADFFGTDLRGSTLIDADFSFANLAKADLRAANLTGAKLVGADLVEVKLSGRTHLTKTELLGAATRSIDLETVSQLQENLSIVFADGSLRDVVAENDWPSHWPRDELEYIPWDSANSPFHAAWRDWAATLDPPVTIAPDYRSN